MYRLRMRIITEYISSTINLPMPFLNNHRENMIENKLGVKNENPKINQRYRMNFLKILSTARDLEHAL